MPEPQTNCAAVDWRDKSRRTPGNDGQASSVFAPAGGKLAETKKARSVVALSRVLSGELSSPVSPPAAGQSSWRDSPQRAWSPQAAGGPLVPLPTDRHATTGTCEIGQIRNNIFRPSVKHYARNRAKNFRDYEDVNVARSHRARQRASESSRRCRSHGADAASGVSGRRICPAASPNRARRRSSDSLESSSRRRGARRRPT